MTAARLLKTLLPLAASHVSALCMTSAALQSKVAAVAAQLALPADAVERVQGYVKLLLQYNERTNVYSKTAYDKLPFHLEDSLTLALLVGETAQCGAVDLGSGSGLPSLLISCVNPALPIFAVESKSRKTRFLAHAARELRLSAYTPLTQNVNELSRSWAFDCDVVTAKAFKPLNEVGPIARRCISEHAQLLVPISEAQVREFSLCEEQLSRRGPLIYYSEAIRASHGMDQRKHVTQEAVRTNNM